MDKVAIQDELAKVRRRIKLINSFKNYGDSLNESIAQDVVESSELNKRQKELVALLRGASKKN